LDSEPTNIFVFSLTDVGNGRENRYSDPVVTVEVPSPDAFFVFHHVNGWIRAEDNVMVMDMCSYDDMNGVLGENVIGNLADLLDPDVRNNMEYLCDSIRRVEIQLPCEENIPELVETKTVSPLSNNILPVIDNTGKKYRLEFLTVNPSYRGRHSCFTYGISYHVGELERYEDTGLVKINTCEAEAFNHSYPSVVDVFHMDDVYLGEPIFVPDPKGLDEDSGALLVVTMNGAVGQTTLMVLDAKSLDVMATIDAPFPLMFEFHGEFFPSND
jgi:carotenoid cleavage dioxygenase-like enzyme